MSLGLVRNMRFHLQQDTFSHPEENTVKDKNVTEYNLFDIVFVFLHIDVKKR